MASLGRQPTQPTGTETCVFHPVSDINMRNKTNTSLFSHSGAFHLLIDYFPQTISGTSQRYAVAGHPRTRYDLGSQMMQWFIQDSVGILLAHMFPFH